MEELVVPKGLSAAQIYVQLKWMADGREISMKAKQKEVA